MPMHKVLVITTFGNPYRENASVAMHELEFDNQADRDAAVLAIRNNHYGQEYLKITAIVLC